MISTTHTHPLGILKTLGNSTNSTSSLPPTVGKMFFFLLFLLALLGAQDVQGHMVMNTPAIYGGHLPSTWFVTAPGAGKPFPYPCQGMTEVVYRTPVTAGSSTLTNYTGQGTHKSGSCQFSLNYHTSESAPYTANPEHWKVIYTIIGGCPAEVTATSGNLDTPELSRGMDANGNPDAVHCGDDKGVNCIRQFNIPFPEELPSGNATFAFTWYNQVTAGELYMNCAPVEIKSKNNEAPEDSKFLNSLPNMFLANIPGYTNCTTSVTGEQKGPFNIPNPGNYGVQLIEPDPIAAGDCPVAPPAPFAGAGKGAPKSSATIQPSSSSSSFVLPSSSGFRTSTTVRPPRPSTPTTTPVVTLTATTSTQRASTTSAAPTGNPGGDSHCTTSGQLVCISDSEFGICDGQGHLGNAQKLNPQQECVDGQVLYRGPSQ